MSSAPVAQPPPFRATPPVRTVTDPVGLSWLVTVRWTTLLAGAGAVVAGPRRPGTAAALPAGAGRSAAHGASPTSGWRGAFGAGARRRPRWPARSSSLDVVRPVVAAAAIRRRPQSGQRLLPRPDRAGGARARPHVDMDRDRALGGRLRRRCSSCRPRSCVGRAGMHPEIGLHMRGMWLAFALTALIIGVLVTRLAIAVERRDRALAALREQPAAPSRFAGLTTLAAGAAHELSTPLATIAVAAHELERTLDASCDREQRRRRTAHLDPPRDRPLPRDPRRSGRPHRASQPAKAPQPRVARRRRRPGAVADCRRPSGRVCDVRIASHAWCVWPVGVVAQAIVNLVHNALQASPLNDAA